MYFPDLEAAVNFIMHFTVSSLKLLKQLLTPVICSGIYSTLPAEDVHFQKCIG